MMYRKLLQKTIVYAILGLVWLAPFSTSLSAQSVNTPDEDSNFASSIAQSDYIKIGLTKEGFNKSIENQNKIEQTDIWTPTDYTKGEVVSNSKNYTVQLGDTLWEIAEGYYGNGAKWLKILDSNKSTILFQLDGEQSLIFPDQILNLP